MKMNTLLTGSVLVLSLAATQAHAEIGTAEAHMKVVAGLTITNNSNLMFSEAMAGAVPEVVDADSVETDQNASFAITGEANRAITVTLPADGTVVMSNGGGSADDMIAVNSFTSNNPTALDGSGDAELFVGATREALSATQTGGDYVATFDVDVVYQ